MTDSLAGRWRGATVVCAGSGPSLSVADLELVGAAGLPLLVANNTWRLAPWADALVAMDTAWWKECGAEAAAWFPGERIAFTPIALKYGATVNAHGTMLHHFGNSGAAAIAVAVRGGAERVLLIGFDGSAAPDGRLHWHADHPAPLKNPQASIKDTWPRQFERVADHARRAGTVVLNCSRRSTIKAFDCLTLEEALRQSRPVSTRSTSATSGTAPPAPPRAPLATAPSASPAA